MPFCAHCRRGYAEGTKRCPECGGRLTPGPEYVRLTKLSDPSAAEVLKGTLAEAGIPAIVQTHGGISGALATVAKSVTDDYAFLLVPEDCLAEAERILAALESGPVEWPEGMEPEE